MRNAMKWLMLAAAAVPAMWAGDSTPAPVPEPGTLLMMGVGLGAVALVARKRRKK